MIDQKDKSSKTEIVPVPVQPLVTPEQAAQAGRALLELKQKLLDSADYQMIAGKRFIKKSGLRKIAVCFNLSDRIVEQERTDREDGSFTWRIVVEVEAPNGRVCTGVGICDSRERKFAHVDHDIYATCHTRAKNRAISDMVAGGIVSAEEIEVSSVEITASKAGTDTQVLNKASIIDALELVGLDTEDLKISVKEGKMVVRPTKFLAAAWDKYNQAMWKLGFSWVSTGKESHWKSSE